MLRSLPVGAGVLALLCAMSLLGRSFQDWHFPFMYEWDAVADLAIAQTGVEGAWPSGSARLGAPGALDLSNYPTPEVGQLLALKIFALLGLGPNGVINGYFLLTFFLCAVAAAWAFARLQLRPAWAVTAAVVFSLLPTHFWRGTIHLFVNGYYCVPLLGWVLLRFWRGDGVTLGHLAVCLVAPVVNVYYSFFFAVLLAFVVLMEGVNGRAWDAALRAGRLGVALGVGLLATVARSLPAYAQHDLAFVRLPRDSEVFALKMVQMVLPAFSTVSSYVARAADDYRHTAPLQNENHWTDLGLVGACAFLCTLCAVFALANKKDEEARDVLHASTCNLLCLFYGTLGGFGALFAYLVSPFIRSTNRIEVFVAFFSLLAAARLLQRRVPRRADWPVCAAVLAVLCWDLAHKHVAPDYAPADARYARDAEFFAQLEATLPTGARVYQLPQMSYPEGGMSQFEYDQFRPYLHTHHLVWSFGAVRGSVAEQGNEAASRALWDGNQNGFRAYLRRNGFQGVLLNRKIATAMAQDPEPLLIDALGAAAAQDVVNEFVYFRMDG